MYLPPTSQVGLCWQAPLRGCSGGHRAVHRQPYRPCQGAAADRPRRTVVPRGVASPLPVCRAEMEYQKLCGQWRSQFTPPGVPWKPFPFSKGISLLDIHLEGFSPCLVYRWLDPPHPTWQWSTTPCDFFSDRKCCQAAAMTCGGHCLQVIYAEGGSRAFFYGVMYLQPSVPKHNRPLFARDEY